MQDLTPFFFVTPFFFRAPVRFVERWVISPSAAMTPGLVITTNAWNSGNKAVSSANVILDGSGM